MKPLERFARLFGRALSAAMARAPMVDNLLKQWDVRHQELVRAIARLESKLERLEGGTAEVRRAVADVADACKAQEAALATLPAKPEWDGEEAAHSEIAKLSDDHWVRLWGSHVLHFNAGNADYALRPPPELRKVRSLAEALSTLRPTHVAFFRCEDPCLPSFLLSRTEGADICSIECNPSFSKTVAYATPRDGRVREWDSLESWRTAIRDLATERRESRARALIVTQVGNRADLLDRLARLTAVRSFMTLTCYVPKTRSAAADLCRQGFPEQLAYQLNRDSLIAASFDPASSKWRHFSSTAWNDRAETLIEGPFENFASVGLSMQPDATP